MNLILPHTHFYVLSSSECVYYFQSNNKKAEYHSSQSRASERAKKTRALLNFHSQQNTHAGHYSAFPSNNSRENSMGNILLKLLSSQNLLDINEDRPQEMAIIVHNLTSTRIIHEECVRALRTLGKRYRHCKFLTNLDQAKVNMQHSYRDCGISTKPQTRQKICVTGTIRKKQSLWNKEKKCKL